MAKPIPLIVAPPVLVMVNPCWALVWPTGWLAKLRLAGLALKVGGVRPVPDKATVLGESAALLAIVIVPLCTPAEVGSNCTLMVHEAPLADRFAVQLLVWIKGWVEGMEMLIEVRFTPPLLVSVTDWAAAMGEICPTMVLGKLSEVAESVSVARASPVPLKVAVWVPLASVTESVPLAAPTAVGVKVTYNGQAPLAATELPAQPLVAENGPVSA